MRISFLRRNGSTLAKRLTYPPEFRNRATNSDVVLLVRLRMAFTPRRLTRSFLLALLLCATICGSGKALGDGGEPSANSLLNLLRRDAVVLIRSNLVSGQRVHLDHTFFLSSEAVVLWHTSNAQGLVVLNFRRGN